jgi:hypothetical protein
MFVTTDGAFSMTLSFEAARARRYLLGNASSEESAAIEQDFFEHPDAVDRVAAAEEDLIEDYLADHLNAADRVRFEGSYLASEPHRVRVETVRRLMARAMPASRRRVTSYTPWLALAASVLIAGSVAVWILSPFGKRSADVASNMATKQTPAAQPIPEPTRQPAATPRVFALTVSPAAVRGSSDSPAIVIPAGTDLVALRLESDGEPRGLTPRRVAVRLVTGRTVWEGAVGELATPADRVPGVVARVDVPASSLPADDYVLTLYGADPSGKEVEWTQYFLRVRGR